MWVSHVHFPLYFQFFFIVNDEHFFSIDVVVFSKWFIHSTRRLKALASNFHSVRTTHEERLTAETTRKVGGGVLEEVRWQVDWLVLLQVSVTKMLCILIQIRYTWDKFIAILATFYFSWFLQLVREKGKMDFLRVFYRLYWRDCW